MPSAGFAPISIEKFGGLATFVDPTNLPMYSSPDCQDVEFVDGLVRTRPSFLSQFPVLSLQAFNYLKTYITLNLGLRMLALDSGGSFFKENPQGNLNILVNPAAFNEANSVVLAGSYCNSVSLFGREYLAFGDGKFGTCRALQYDDTNLDIVSQSGPGIAPSVADENVTYNIVASPSGILVTPTTAIATATESGNLVTLNTSAPLPTFLKVGDPITVAGVGIAGYNGSFIIAAIPSTTQLQYINTITGLTAGTSGTVVPPNLYTIVTTAANAVVAGQLVTTAGVTGGANYIGTFTVRAIINSTSFVADLTQNAGAATGGGTVASAGSIVAGNHQISVLYVDREGYLTQPAPPVTWLAAGNKRAVVSLIPVPPTGTNVVQRILVFTPVNADTFFYQDGTAPVFSGNMIINDITTTTVTVDFSDETLLEGTNVDDLFDLVELGACSGVTQSNSRLFWWGERNKLNNLLNMGFQGGGRTINDPGGWKVDPVNGAGGLIFPPVFGSSGWPNSAYSIGSPGGVPIIGRITQSAYQDYFGDPIIAAQTDYSVRATVASSAGTGTLHIHLFSASAGINTTGILFGAGNLTPREVIAQLTPPLTTVPSDLVLRVYVDGTPAINTAFTVFNIEIFPTNQPFNSTIVRVSKAPDVNGLFGPESYSGLDGFLNVAPSNGQAVRSVFVIRNNIYIAKERSLYVTQDNGQEPATWSIQEVSNKVGTLSVRGVALGDEWAIIAAQDGCYYFDGSQPQKISQEIEPTWKQINWTYGHLVNVTVDIERKRVYILAPFGTSTVPNRMLTMDYADGFIDPTPNESVAIAGIGRKWAPWSVSGNSMALILRNNGTLPLFVGNNTNTGKIYGLDPTPWSANNVFSDDGVAINSYYETGFFQDVGRMDFGYISANIVGNGVCSLLLRKSNQQWISNIRGWNLSPLGFHNVERTLPGSLITERLATRIGTNAINNCFSLQGIAMWSKKAAWSPLRGVNF
jgi:hypothetical protein